MAVAHTWKRPRHIAIVMDGNRRFARQLGATNVRLGHQLGADKQHLGDGSALGSYVLQALGEKTDAEDSVDKKHASKTSTFTIAVSGMT